jgi:hypothetical protein
LFFILLDFNPDLCVVIICSPNLTQYVSASRRKSLEENAIPSSPLMADDMIAVFDPPEAFVCKAFMRMRRAISSPGGVRKWQI